MQKVKALFQAVEDYYIIYRDWVVLGLAILVIVQAIGVI